ncbi:MBL fold metallo-hydrolase [Chitinophaga ginsengisoli]|uniref:Glyoxylase-like metal-dependent hydrolase (Beta-lactamase superfamily II) n=1 Tax=Chitinophaga ginsengisoli TaxID=363837 RepID=A0A2P8FMB2_9BACT|nr:MBL fold metallo-hydrolase [Chitinophaga ginsengisoli]PSL22843.1 glyoxylase-like metal-dependent hydrolase (beta-lactamase superfamily II) [Chitinophaga ginsengisoli]
MKFLSAFSLKGFLALSLLSVIFAAKAQTTSSQLPEQPGFYRMQLGDYQVIALSDGTIPLNLKTLLHETKPGEIQELLRNNFLDTVAETSITGFLILANNQQILIDAGCGSFFGPTLGKLKQHLIDAGFHPENITAVLLTHLHTDHVGGLIEGDKMVFPNATIYISKQEAAFWLTTGNKEKANKRAQPFFDPAQTAILPYQKAGKVKTYDPGAQLFPGITSINATGHTPGHSFYMIASKGQKLMFWGDVIHAGAVQFSDPAVTIDFDVDLSAAAAARRKAFNEAVKDGYWIATSHLSFPGIGHLKAVGKQYEWVPANYTTIFTDK